MTEREMFDKLRAGVSLAKFVENIGSQSTTAFWSLYDRGQRPLSVAQKNELRAACGEPLIMDFEAEAGALIASGATAVAGKQPFKLLIFSGRTRGVLTLDESGAHFETVAHKRGKVVRPVATLEQNELRKALGVTWNDVIEVGLQGLRERKVEK